MVEIYCFEYNGLYCRIRHGKTAYTAKFLHWTIDPGVALFKCSDGEERLIPTAAIVGNIPADWPKQPKTGIMFGTACQS